jgi:hypothetical protein
VQGNSNEPLSGRGNSKNMSSTRQSTESNESTAEINTNSKCKILNSYLILLDYTPKNLNSTSKEYNLSQVQKELNFYGNNNQTVMGGSKFNNIPPNKPSGLNMLMNSNSTSINNGMNNNNFIFHTARPINGKSFSFCENGNILKSPTTLKYDLQTFKRNGMPVFFENQNFSMKKEEPVDHKIILDNIIIGKDKRTTLMLRNIPNKYTLQNLVDEINSSFWGKYDYINLPVDYEVKIFSL